MSENDAIFTIKLVAVLIVIATTALCLLTPMADVGVTVAQWK